jgi:hypothetical protein
VIIEVDYKSTFFLIEGKADTRHCIQNLSNLGFMEELEEFAELDQNHRALEWIFQQDGAHCHASQNAIDWIEENCDLFSDWLASSPDPSPIE